MARELVILGGGGHALVVAEAALAAGNSLAGFLDDDPFAPLWTGSPKAPRLGGMDALDLLRDPARGWIIGVGDLDLRRALIARLEGLPGAASVIHPRASVSPSASIGGGTFIGPGAVVHTRARIGEHAIINSGAIVEHECVIGANAHVAPGAALAGRASVGPDTLVGLGARVLPGVAIGARCIIGAGAVVVEDVPDERIAAGVPASTRGR
ncbi:MAG: acetyltransferase [Candidatus Rokubacteria bacterium]|nr:acetyltransferase [Candidatus Rokubacteria bacterium]